MSSQPLSPHAARRRGGATPIGVAAPTAGIVSEDAFVDGKREPGKRESPVPIGKMRLEVGARAEVVFKGHSELYLGTVKAHKDDGTMTVHFDNDDTVETITPGTHAFRRVVAQTDR
jgi:hypothetical protein